MAHMPKNSKNPVLSHPKPRGVPEVYDAACFLATRLGARHFISLGARHVDHLKFLGRHFLLVVVGEAAPLANFAHAYQDRSVPEEQPRKPPLLGFLFDRALLVAPALGGSS